MYFSFRRLTGVTIEQKAAILQAIPNGLCKGISASMQAAMTFKSPRHSFAFLSALQQRLWAHVQHRLNGYVHCR